MFLINSLWRFFYLFIVLAIVLLHFILLDFFVSFFYPTYGLIGLSVGLVLILFFFFFSDSIILWFTRARTGDRNLDFDSWVANFQAQLGIKQIRYYRTSKRKNNIFLVASFKGVPSIIIGDNVASILSGEEFKRIVFATIAKIKSHEVAKRTFVSTTLSIILWPFVISSNNKKIIIIKNMLVYFLIPIFFLKGKIFNEEETQIAISEKIKKTFGSDQLYRSAIYKISEVEIKKSGEINFLDILTDDLSMVMVNPGDYIINTLQSVHSISTK